MNRTTLIILGVVGLVVGLVLFLGRRKAQAGMFGNTPAGGSAASILSSQTPITAFPTPTPTKSTSGVDKVLGTVATLGCAGAATYYTAGTAVPLCGLAAPITVGVKNAVVAGTKGVAKASVSAAKTTVSVAKKIIPFW